MAEKTERSSIRLLNKASDLLVNFVKTRGAEDVAITGDGIGDIMKTLRLQIAKNTSTESRKLALQENMGTLAKIKNSNEKYGNLIKSEVGGKATSSMNQIKLGYNVPNFFTVTAAAYRELTAGIENQIDKYFSVDYSDNYIGYNNRSENLEKNALKPIREWIIDQNFSPSTTIELRKEWAMLTIGKPENFWTDEDRKKAEDFSLAVRSTSLEEDGDENSFAGQQLSLINVKGFDNFILAIKEVMASVYSLSAIQYRTQRGIDITNLAMPVMVQHTVPLNSGYAVYGFSEVIDSNQDSWLNYSVVRGYGTGIADGLSRATEIKINKKVKSNLNLYQLEQANITTDDIGMKKDTYAKNIETAEIILYKSEYYPHQLKIFVANTTIKGIVSSKDYITGVEAPQNEGFLDINLTTQIENELTKLQSSYNNRPQDAELGFVPYKIVNEEKIYKNNNLLKNNDQLVLLNDNIFDQINSEVYYEKWNIQSRDITTNKSNKNGIFPEKMPNVNNPVFAEGRAGSEGIVTGRVRIVPNAATARKLSKIYEDYAEIALTPFAEVDFGNAFIVTEGAMSDIGSDTSHAAIVLRELQRAFIYNISKLIKSFEINAKNEDEVKELAILELTKKGFKPSDFPYHIIEKDEENKFIVVFSRFYEGQLLTMNGYNGKIYEGAVKELTDYQEKKEIYENAALLEDMKKEPTKFNIGCNASTSIAAKQIAEKGIKYNTLSRGEVWIANAELEIEEPLKNQIMLYMLSQGWIDQSYINTAKLKGIDQRAIIDIAKNVEGKNSENIKSSIIYQAWVKAGAVENANIAKYFEESTHRISGNAPEGRKLVGSEIFKKGLEIQDKTAFNQGVAMNMKYQEDTVMEFEMFKEVKNILDRENKNVKLKIMPQFIRTYEELSKWLDLADKNGINKENGFMIGTMIEVPLNVMSTDYDYSDLEKILRDPRIEFVSVGSNDLTSLSAAYNRAESESVENYPANLPQFTNIIRTVAKIAKKYNKKSSICGELVSSYKDMATNVISWGYDSTAVANNIISIRDARSAAKDVEKRPLILGKRAPIRRLKVKSIV